MKGIPREVEDAEIKHRVTNSSQIRELRKNFLLSDYQKDVLIGTLLGDGSLYSDGWSENYRLQIVQGDKQKDYLFWKFNVFSNCCCSAPSYQKLNQSWRIRTISHNEFNCYAKMFYTQKKKVVPSNLSEYLNPLALAVWFMDDGALGPRGEGYILNTQSFSFEENDYLRKCLMQTFQLPSVSIHKDKKWWRLYISKGSIERFRILIDPYIVPSMRYKIHTSDPVETTRRLRQKLCDSVAGG